MLFHDLRSDEDGDPRAGLPAQRTAGQAPDPGRGAQFRQRLVARGRGLCAVRAGFRCVIAPSFGDIFAQRGQERAVGRGCCGRRAEELAEAVIADSAAPITVDLAQQTITCGNRNYSFIIDR